MKLNLLIIIGFVSVSLIVSGCSLLTKGNGEELEANQNVVSTPTKEDTTTTASLEDPSAEHESEDKTPVEKLLSDAEIREVMEKYLKIKERLGELANELEMDATNVRELPVEEFRPNFSDLVTTSYMETLPSYMYYYIKYFGEGFTDPNFDVRFKIVENMPNKLKVKTMLLEDEAGYTSPGNVYLTAIKEGDQWLIDDYTFISSQEELLNVTPEEFQRAYQSWGIDLKFLKREVVNTAVYDPTKDEYISKDLEALFFVDQKSGSYTGVTVDYGTLVWDIPEDIQ